MRFAARTHIKFAWAQATLESHLVTEGPNGLYYLPIRSKPLYGFRRMWPGGRRYVVGSDDTYSKGVVFSTILRGSVRW